MKSKFTGILTLFLAFFIQFSFAQEKTITGTVVSQEDGFPLPGVSIMVQGTTRGTQTDFDGNFSIGAAQGEKLVFSFIGKASQTITVSSATKINVSLVDDNVLETVVVEGYSRGTTKKLSNNAVTTVTSKTIEGRPNASFIQTLQGQIPGLNISTGSGQPGANSTVILRGYGSVNGNVEPLYVIDGVPLNTDNFRSINPNDIESISVLKDAGATAIYGNRGANGVIIVTTKKGSFEAGLDVKYSSVVGFTTLQGNDYRVMNSKQLLATEKLAGQGYGATLTDEEIANHDVNTNWRKEIFRTGISQSHNLSLTNGGKNINSYTSLGFFDQEGILRNTDLKRFTFRNNTSGKSDNGKFTYGSNVTLNYAQSHEAWGVGEASVNLNPIFAANNALPYINPDWITWGKGASQQILGLYNGSNNPYGFGSGTLAFAPLMLLEQFDSFYNGDTEIKAIANIQGAYKLTDNITVGNTFGLDFQETQFLRHRTPYNFTESLFQAANEEYLGFESGNTVRQALINNVTRLNYNKVFADKHTLDVSLFTEYFKAHRRSMSYTQNGLDPKVSGPGTGIGWIGHNPNSNPNLYVPAVGASKVDAGLFSYFAQADYDYSQKYGIAATVRRDASYRFAESNRWGTFWSVSGRWNIDQEEFMADTKFSMLKLRASYGSSGNQNISGQSIFNLPSATRSLYATGVGYANNNVYVLSQLGNDDLKWESIYQANVGVDFGLWSNRLRGNLDVYKKTTKDLYMSTPLSAITGFGSLNANTGSLENSGIEALVSYDLFKNDSDFQLTLTANGSYNKNRIKDVANEEGLVDLGSQVYQNDRQMLEYYLVKYAGVNPANGHLLFYTKDGQLTENPDEVADRRLTGKSPIPVYQGGFGFDANYKGFFLSTQFNFVADVWRFDTDLEALTETGMSTFGQFNKSTDLLRAWTPENRITDMPALNHVSNTYTVQDRYLTDASYLRLRYLSLGYDFNKEFLKGTSLKTVRVYAQAENLVTFSKWRGWDAESNRAQDMYEYPTPRIISFGLDVQF